MNLLKKVFFCFDKQQNDLMPGKRSKPSLSIVNPLDVLRQRLLLEMARRQMRENSRQVIQLQLTQLPFLAAFLGKNGLLEA